MTEDEFNTMMRVTGNVAHYQAKVSEEMVRHEGVLRRLEPIIVQARKDCLHIFIAKPCAEADEICRTCGVRV